MLFHSCFKFEEKRETLFHHTRELQTKFMEKHLISPFSLILTQYSQLEKEGWVYPIFGGKNPKSGVVCLEAFTNLLDEPLCIKITTLHVVDLVVASASDNDVPNSLCICIVYYCGIQIQDSLLVYYLHTGKECIIYI